MSSLALMRWLEGSPGRYDAGMRLLTFGRVTPLHDAVAEAAVANPGQRVLEIGCGTGAVTERLIERGACVTAIDQSSEMLAQARARISEECAGQIEFIERTAAEIDALPSDHFDAVVLSLCLSDMSPSERAFVLRESERRLLANGRLVVGDEVRPSGGLLTRSLHRLWRVPQAALGWLLIGSLSQPIPDLGEEIRAAGMTVQRTRSWLMGSLALVVATPERRT